MLTPYEFFTRFHQVCGQDAAHVWTALSAEDVQMLVEDDDKDAWAALDTFIELVMFGDPAIPKSNDMPLPAFNCKGCTHYLPVNETKPICAKSLKPLPNKLICKYFAI